MIIYFFKLNRLFTIGRTKQKQRELRFSEEEVDNMVKVFLNLILLKINIHKFKWETSYPFAFSTIFSKRCIFISNCIFIQPCNLNVKTAVRL